MGHLSQGHRTNSPQSKVAWSRKCDGLNAFDMNVSRAKTIGANPVCNARPMRLDLMTRGATLLALCLVYSPMDSQIRRDLSCPDGVVLAPLAYKQDARMTASSNDVHPPCPKLGVIGWKASPARAIGTRTAFDKNTSAMSHRSPRRLLDTLSVGVWNRAFHTTLLIHVWDDVCNTLLASCNMSSPCRLLLLASVSTKQTYQYNSVSDTGYTPARTPDPNTCLIQSHGSFVSYVATPRIAVCPT